MASRSLGALLGTLYRQTPRRRWLVIVLGFIFLEGITAQLLGPLLPALRRQFDVSASLGGLAGTLNTVGFMLAVLVTGALFAAVDRKRGAVLGVAAVLTALVVVTTATVYVVFLAGIGLRALGTGVFRGIDKPVLSHLFPEHREALLNVYELTWAVGAATAPLVATAALTYATWHTAYVAVLLLTVPLVAAVVVTPLPAGSIDERSFPLSESRALLNRPPVRWTTLGLLLSGGIEGSVFVWLPTYLQQFVSVSTANLAFSAFFLTYIPARLFHTVSVDHFGELPLLLGSGLGTTVLLLYGATGTGVGAVTAMSVLGFFLAGLFPLLSAYAIDSVPERSGPVNALTLGASFTGSSLTVFVVGVLVDAFSITVGIQFLGLYAVALLGVLSWMYRRNSRE